MDQGALVTEQIEAGARFLTEFDKSRPIQIDFWFKDGEERAWRLYVALDQVSDDYATDAYDEVVRIGLGMHDPRLPKDCFSALALQCFLNSTRKGGQVEKAPVQFLDKVPSLLKPVADCLRYEVLVARKEEKAAKQLKEHILRDHPGLKWRIDAADKGRGTLATILRDPPW